MVPNDCSSITVFTTFLDPAPRIFAKTIRYVSSYGCDNVKYFSFFTATDDTRIFELCEGLNRTRTERIQSTKLNGSVA